MNIQTHIIKHTGNSKAREGETRERIMSGKRCYSYKNKVWRSESWRMQKPWTEKRKKFIWASFLARHKSFKFIFSNSLLQQTSLNLLAGRFVVNFYIVSRERWSNIWLYKWGVISFIGHAFKLSVDDVELSIWEDEDVTFYIPWIQCELN